MRKTIGPPSVGRNPIAAKESASLRLLNSKWSIRSWLASRMFRMLQILDLQYVCATAGVTYGYDNECRRQTEADEEESPAQ
jgi:hypothetical protein